MIICRNYAEYATVHIILFVMAINVNNITHLTNLVECKITTPCCLQGVILMYSVDDMQSYNDLTTWQADIERYCPSGTRILIIGNKCDLFNRVVPVEQGLLVRGLRKLNDNKEYY